MKIFLQLILATISINSLLAQNEITIKFPDQENWNVITEGETLDFKLEAAGGLSGQLYFLCRQ